MFCLQGLAVAVSGDVYTAKAVIAARTPGAGGVGVAQAALVVLAVGALLATVARRRSASTML